MQPALPLMLKTNYLVVLCEAYFVTERKCRDVEECDGLPFLIFPGGTPQACLRASRERAPHCTRQWSCRGPAPARQVGSVGPVRSARLTPRPAQW